MAVSAEFVSDGKSILLHGADPDEYIFSKIRSSNNFYEHGLLRSLATLPLPPGVVAVDVGANIGNHTVFFAKVMGLAVRSFEPAGGNFDLLLRNVQANAVEEKVVAQQIALADRSGRADMVQRIPGNSGSYALGQWEAGGVVAVQRLDDVMDASVSVGILKIDTEGSEAAVLAGASEVIGRSLPFISVEIHSSADFRLIADVLAPHGYGLLDIQGLSDNYIFGAREAPWGPEWSMLASEVGVRSDRSRHREISDRLGRTATSAQVAALEESLTRSLTGEIAGLESRFGARLSERNDLQRVRGELESLSESNDTLNRQLLEVRGSLAEAQDANHFRKAANERLEAQVVQLKQELLHSRRFSKAWEDAYANIASSRALKTTRAIRELAAKVGLAETPRTPLGTTSRKQEITERVNSEAGLRAFGPRETDAQQEARGSGRGGGQSTARYSGLDSWASSGAVAIQGSEPVRVGLATIPERKESLRRVVTSLYNQVDEICIYLNGYEEVPDFLQGDPKIRAELGPDLGDRGKFAFLAGFEGYYLTADDDIDYPPFYVSHCIDGIERFSREAVVGWHGSVLKFPFSHYYSAESRHVLTFSSERGRDTQVHILGTGCAAFHTDTMKPSLRDFPHPSMADVFFALQGQIANVPFVVLRHGREWATPIETGDSISAQSIARSGSVMDVGAAVDALVMSHPSWRFPSLAPSLHRTPLAVDIIGRTSVARWRKGGILKSNLMMEAMLRGLGVDVSLFDIEASEASGASGNVVILYTGDPERPDFARVEQLISEHARRGAVVIVNVSINMRPDRARHIASRLREWGQEYGGRVYVLAFSDAVTRIRELSEFATQMVVLPKTIDTPQGDLPNFDDTSGVFIGDFGKLCNPALFDHPVEEWIGAIKRALPGVSIHAIQQYKPQQPRELGIRVHPYLDDGFVEWVSQSRLMVSPFRFCTFEMVPLEVAGAGIPVAYRNMEQSLAEYLGMGGLSVESPVELSEVLPELYHDRRVWDLIRSSGAARARSQSQYLQAGMLYIRLSQLAQRHGLVTPRAS